MKPLKLSLRLYSIRFSQTVKGIIKFNAFSKPAGMPKTSSVFKPMMIKGDLK